MLCVADLPVCFENNLVLAFKGRSSRVAKRESCEGAEPPEVKSHSISKMEVFGSWGSSGGGGGVTGPPRLVL